MINGKMEDLILFEDKDLIVCQKPAGIAVQSAGIGSMDLESCLKNYLVGKNGKALPYLAVIHRLDQPVEGVLVFGKNPSAAKNLSRQITEGKMEKIYLAVTYGKPFAKEGILEDFLKKDGRTNTSAVVQKGTPGSKKARLTFQVLEECTAPVTKKQKWLLCIHLDTGRHHQIRVQMANAGMALAGDRKYGGEEIRQKGTLGLCAYSLTFSHPSSKRRMKYETMPKSPVFEGFLGLKR